MSAQGRKVHVLFVCGGNTCRSPMAAAIANAKHGDVVLAESAGTDKGECKANELAVQVVRDRFGTDLDLSDHKPRDIDCVNMEAFDVVIAMHGSVADDLARYRSRINRLEVWNVCDPYSKGKQAYETAAEEILRQVERLVQRLR